MFMTGAPRASYGHMEEDRRRKLWIMYRTLIRLVSPISWCVQTKSFGSHVAYQFVSLIMIQNGKEAVAYVKVSVIKFCAAPYV